MYPVYYVSRTPRASRRFRVASRNRCPEQPRWYSVNATRTVANTCCGTYPAKRAGCLTDFPPVKGEKPFSRARAHRDARDSARCMNEHLHPRRAFIPRNLLPRKNIPYPPFFSPLLPSSSLPLSLFLFHSAAVPRLQIRRARGRGGILNIAAPFLSG